MGKLVRAISADGSAVAYSLDGLDIVSQIESIHKTSAVVTAALGRLSIAASIMGIMLKGDDDSITLRINGGGPTGSLIAVADSSGNVKSYVAQPVVEIPLNERGKLDVAGAVGKEGTLSVVKDLGLKEPYVGQVPLVSGEIAEDITSYFATSEQVPTVCCLGVLVNPDLTVRAAGGYIIQLLPYADEKTIEVIEENIKKIPAVTQMYDTGMNAESIALTVLDGLEPNLLDSRETSYHCDCSRERVIRALVSLGRDELTKMAEEEEKTEVSCHFCNKKYTFTSDEIAGLVKGASKKDDSEEA